MNVVPLMPPSNELRLITAREERLEKALQARKNIQAQCASLIEDAVRDLKKGVCDSAETSVEALSGLIERILAIVISQGAALREAVSGIVFGIMFSGLYYGKENYWAIQILSGLIIRKTLLLGGNPGEAALGLVNGVRQAAEGLPIVPQKAVTEAISSSLIAAYQQDRNAGKRTLDALIHYRGETAAGIDSIRKCRYHERP